MKEIQVEKDIKAAIDIMNLKKVDLKQYRPVKLFPSYSLKTFKKYKLDGKKALTKCNSTAEILDLVSYGADVTCYSSNRLDEYFLKLQLALLDLKYKEYVNYFFGRNKGTSKELYDKIKNDLDEDVRYFFDELYKYVTRGNMYSSKLCDLRKADYEELKRFIRYFLEPKYYKTAENKKICTPEFILCKDISIPLFFDDDTFNFINLSYNIDNMDKEKIRCILKKMLKDFEPLLKEYGKIQVFTGTKEIEIPELKRNDTRSIIDPNSENSSCKKDYAYVYSKQ